MKFYNKNKVNPRLNKSELLQRCKLEKCQGVCCSYGVWMDKGEVQDILEHSAWICPHMPPGLEEPDLWFEDRKEADEYAPSGEVIHSTVVDDSDSVRGTTCVFRRKDHKCALQVAADAKGFHPWRFKPFYCVLHPLDLDEEGQITLPDFEEIIDEPASCLRSAAKPIPLLVTFEEELRYLLGDAAYEDLKSNCN